MCRRAEPWLAIVMVAGCGRIGFDPTAGEDGLPARADGAAGDGTVIDARTLVSPPVVMAEPGASVGCPSLVATADGFAVAWRDGRGGPSHQRPGRSPINASSSR